MRWSMRGVLGLSVSLALFGCATPPPDTGAATLDLGTFHREVGTRSAEAQAWCDRGLALVYGFNHEEAIRCFERAAYEDPGCAFAWWGVAYSLGPHINNPAMDAKAERRAMRALRRAEALADAPTTTDVERALIGALGARYASPAGQERAALDKAYAAAMLPVYEAHPNDADVAALYAESVMMLRPWKQWSKDGKPEEGTAEIVAALEKGLAMAPDHPALCHFYIHAVEASPHPEKALPAADRLRARVPDAGHLVHMPSHIDVLLGRYDEAIAANQRATAADGKYLALRGANNFYTLYRAHAWHFIVYAAMFAGNRAEAVRAADAIREHVPLDLVLTNVDMLDGFVPTRLHVMVRFGMWDEILREPAPDERLPFASSVWRYARGVALAAKGRVAEAKQEREAFERERARVPESSVLFNNTSRSILAIAAAMLDGEIAYRERRYDEAFERLREAVALDDDLNYDEPWGWMQPARHALGALLLEQGRTSEAEAVYRADLKRNPNNVWSLQGLAEALRTGGGDKAELARVEETLRARRASADVPIEASCYCRVGTAG